MLTKQGVPLFYPFKKNPCVIPGNPDMRLRSSDLKTEAACFAIFILLGITCQNLFANGFWNTFNRQFADLKHLHQESVQSETLLSVTYQFRNGTGKEFSGSGILVKSSENEAIIWDKQQFVTIGKTDRIINLIPARTKQMMATREIFFSNISPDSLQKLIAQKPIISVTLQSSTPFSFTKENKPETASRAELAYIVDPVLDFTIKNQQETDTSNTEGKRRLLQLELANELKKQRELYQSKAYLQNAIQSLTREISEMELYEREKATKELQKLKTDLANFPKIEDNSQKISIQIQNLKSNKKADYQVIISRFINILNI